ncbi:hypothetical protein B0A48_01059 [Cryoendolithus antarcticus]|uniref:L-ascorbate oxidase n=1 Tax=Cryoendolithus antarcticus TaxID=1507870 RepID=A0A1V8TS52_9PEZI|nr:hypothetical protein B0A48_01059 [Cryoendolithus antarcticus]
MSVVVNGTTPEPAIRIPAGKTSWIRVYNDMPDQNTTMHWHGLSQRTAIFSDGTYFYYSHVGLQAHTSSGSLIVTDNGPPPYRYDDERIIEFGDFCNATDASIEDGLVAHPFVWSGETHGVLIDGVGVATGSIGGTAGCVLPVIDVEPSKTYRLRFIGSTALSMVQFGIADHGDFTIIGADGQYTKPYDVRYMQVSTGQRFEVLFKTKSKAELGNQTDFVIYCNAAPIVTTAPATPPLTFSNVTYNWAEYALQPLKPNDFPTASQVTRRVEIRNRQMSANNASVIWAASGLQWIDTTAPSGKPYLVSIYENGPSAIPNYTNALANYGWDPITKAWPAKIGEVLEIVIYNQPSIVENNYGLDFHPFHAHGRHYYDIGSGNGTYDPAANELRLKGYNPVLRDTTNLYRYTSAQTVDSLAGWRAWRIRVEDAGVWMIHCHILQHMIMGMQTVWVMGDYEQIASIQHYDAAGYLEYGGNAYGNDSYTPSYVHQFS